MNINQNPVAKALIFGLLVAGGTGVTPITIATLHPEHQTAVSEATNNTHIQNTENSPSVTNHRDYTNQ